MMQSKVFIIPTHHAFSFKECAWFLHRNFDDCMHLVKNDTIYKALLFDDVPVLFSISAHPAGLQVQVLNAELHEPLQQYIASYIQDWFDLDRNIAPFYVRLSVHPVLAYMRESYAGLRLIGIVDLFEALCWSIIGQQINLPFAYKMKRRMVEKFGTTLTYNDEKFYIFPTPQQLLTASIDDLRAMQFSQKKAEYVLTLAQAFADGSLSKPQLANLPSLTDKQKALTSLRGIGIWTANYALMKSLHELSCVPHGDVGLLKALEQHSIIAQRNETGKIETLFKDFAGWEAYLVIYLWRTLAKMPGE
ncbi:DNA-3-methyladenine glycosylase II [Chitinophaga skermanii]|uniref:DNA-3-methyladenine glycosylase II n=1 Tax=Chitinophaga skermanii TaxID=331697 RepID=A0A327R2U4_9BACT|nr:DNA-3-methyladenine glycosylase [Chitinophaga skermanii]RAJ10555.1 DNA-3-methyladenine glycosylase II [Chitinophaga skermanii]